MTNEAEEDALWRAQMREKLRKRLSRLFQRKRKEKDIPQP
jgi:hypothetical protein